MQTTTLPQFVSQCALFRAYAKEAGLKMRDEIFTPMTSLPCMSIGQISQALRPESWALSKCSVKVPDGEVHVR